MTQKITEPCVFKRAKGGLCNFAFYTFNFKLLLSLRTKPKDSYSEAIFLLLQHKEMEAHSAANGT